MRQDLRYAFRGLRRNPGFAVVVILTPAVAIGMNTAIFSVFNAVVLRPLAYPHPERLVWLSAAGAEDGAQMVIAPEFVDWREHATSFDRMVAYGTADHTLALPRGATRIRGAMVSHDFWDLSGVVPASGRVPRPEDREIVVLSQRFAERWFADDPDVIGRTVTLDGRPVAVVGVLPERFLFHLPGSGWIGFRPRDVDVYVPLTVSGARDGPMQLLSVVGRLKAGVPLEQARAQIDAIRARTEEAHPNPIGDHRTVRVSPLHDELIGGASQALLVLLGAVGFVLLIACANASGLLIARTADRQREIAIRMSVGAGRARVLRQLFVESVVLAVLGSAAGVLLARLAVGMILRFDPQAIPRLGETTVDARVLLVTLGACMATAVVFGLAPGLAVWRMDPHDILRRGISVASPAGSSVRTRRALVAGEVDRTQVADDVMSLEQVLADSIAPRRWNLVLLGTFAAVALFLAVIGIYGVMAYSVTQRMHELGVRMALGAQPTDVIRMVIGQGMRVAGAGIVAGLVAALALTRVMEGLLYEVRPVDPWTFAAVTVALALTAVVACCIPAINAARVDPVITLRYDA